MSGSDQVANRGKGSVGFWGTLPQSTDAIIFRLWNTSGLPSDAILKDDLTFADITSSGGVKSDSTSYADQSVTTITDNVDTTNDRCDVSVTSPGTVTFPTVGGATNHAISKLTTGYSPASGSADSAIPNATQHSFDVTPDGTDIVATVNVFFRASS